MGKSYIFDPHFRRKGYMDLFVMIILQSGRENASNNSKTFPLTMFHSADRM